MTKASDNLFPGIIIRESADDGSDFSNPAADYRRFFLGEDGQLHVKDSAGAVTDIGGAAGPGGGSLVIGDWSGATQQTVSGTATWTEGTDEIAGRDVLSCLFDDQSGGDLAAILKTIGGSSPWRIQTAIRCLSRNQNYWMAGLVMTDGTATSSKVAFAQFTHQSDSMNSYLYKDGTLTNYSAAFSTIAAPIMVHTGNILHIRLTWVSANTFRMELSPDAVSWTAFAVADAAMTMTPTHVGFAVSTESSATTPRIATFEYFLEEAG